MHIRPFVADDIPACLAVFDSNTPPYFQPHERDEYRAFLDEPDGEYFVGMEIDAIVACGGYWILPHAPVAVLTWGMVHHNSHRRGLGLQLLHYRLAAIRTHPGLVAVRLETSHLTAPFFSKAGFTTEQVTENGYGLGIDQHAMGLALV